MPCRNDAWDHWYDDLGVSTRRLQRQVKCKFCPLTIAYMADRMFAHLGYRHPQGGIRDVSICRMVPRSAKQLFENCEGTVSILPTATLESVNDVRAKEEVEELEPVLSQCGITAGNHSGGEAGQLHWEVWRHDLLRWMGQYSESTFTQRCSVWSKWRPFSWHNRHHRQP